MKHLFYDDYSEGAHPELLAALTAGNVGQQPGYSKDEASEQAADRIRQRFAVDGDVHILPGSTHANLIGLGSMMRSYEGVIAPTTGHINTHETGAIEATGHRIIAIDAPAGKLTPELIDRAAATHQDEHTVMPRVVFLTQATEEGTVYSAEELRLITAHAKSLGLYVFLDGARLSMALASEDAAMAPANIAASGVDMFTIGGTKVGGLYGDALVIVNAELQPNFRYHLKQRGALLAKGRFMGLQFLRFFAEDDLWFELGRQSNDNARRLAEGLIKLHVPLAHPRQINQVFPILTDAVADKLGESYGFYEWSRVNEQSAVRRVTCSWATPHDAIDNFLSDLAALL